MYIHPNAFILLTGCFKTCPRLFSNIHWIVWEHSPKSSTIFPGMFGDIPRNVWRHSAECLATFPGMFGDIPRDVWGHSLECLVRFPGNFLGKVWRHSPECLGTFPGMFGHSPEYNIPPIPRVSCIPFSVPVLLVLYIAEIE